MFRLWVTAFFIFVLTVAGFAQPPVELVGPSEQVCSTDLHLGGDNSCPLLPLARSTTYLRNIDGTVVSLPKGFEMAHAVASRDDERGEGYYIFGELAGKGGAPYLAFALKDSLAFSGTWEFFTGRGLSGSTNWVGFDRWQFHTDAEGSWNPGERAKVFSPEEGCNGFQVDWNAPLGRWLMLYGCGGAAWVRVSQKPSGPWSEPTLLADHVAADGPVLLSNLDTIGSTEAGSRSTIIYWGVSMGQDARYQVMRAVLRQEGEQ
jgi:hypothetical protein